MEKKIVGKEDFVKIVRNTVDGVTKKKIHAVINATLNTIAQLVKDGHTVRFIDFGSFLTSDRKERKSFNPHTKKPMVVPAHKAVRFKSSIKLGK